MSFQFSGVGCQPPFGGDNHMDILSIIQDGQVLITIVTILTIVAIIRNYAK